MANDLNERILILKDPTFILLCETYKTCLDKSERLALLKTIQALLSLASQ